MRSIDFRDLIAAFPGRKYKEGGSVNPDDIRPHRNILDGDQKARLWRDTGDPHQMIMDSARPKNRWLPLPELEQPKKFAEGGFADNSRPGSSAGDYSWMNGMSAADPWGGMVMPGINTNIDFGNGFGMGPGYDNNGRAIGGGGNTNFGASWSKPVAVSGNPADAATGILSSTGQQTTPAEQPTFANFSYTPTPTPTPTPAATEQPTFANINYSPTPTPTVNDFYSAPSAAAPPSWDHSNAVNTEDQQASSVNFQPAHPATPTPYWGSSAHAQADLNKALTEAPDNWQTGTDLDAMNARARIIRDNVKIGSAAAGQSYSGYGIDKITARVMAESKGLADAENTQAGVHAGLAQWSPARYAQMTDYTNGLPSNLDNVQKQAQYVGYSYGTPGHGLLTSNFATAQNDLSGSDPTRADLATAAYERPENWKGYNTPLSSLGQNGNYSKAADTHYNRLSNAAGTYNNPSYSAGSSSVSSDMNSGFNLSSAPVFASLAVPSVMPASPLAHPVSNTPAWARADFQQPDHPFTPTPTPSVPNYDPLSSIAVPSLPKQVQTERIQVTPNYVDPSTVRSITPSYDPLSSVRAPTADVPEGSTISYDPKEQVELRAPPLPALARDFLSGSPAADGFAISPGIPVGDMKNPFGAQIVGTANVEGVPRFAQMAMAGDANSYSPPAGLTSYRDWGTGRMVNPQPEGMRGDRPAGTAAGGSTLTPQESEVQRKIVSGEQISPLEGTSDIDKKIMQALPMVANIAMPIMMGPFAPLFMAANLGAKALTGKSLIQHMADNPGDITALGLDRIGGENGTDAVQNLQRLAKAGTEGTWMPIKNWSPTQTTTDVPDVTSPVVSDSNLSNQTNRRYIPAVDFASYGEHPEHSFFEDVA